MVETIEWHPYFIKTDILCILKCFTFDFFHEKIFLGQIYQTMKLNQNEARILAWNVYCF